MEWDQRKILAEIEHSEIGREGKSESRVKFANGIYILVERDQAHKRKGWRIRDIGNMRMILASRASVFQNHRSELSGSCCSETGYPFWQTG